MGHSLRSEPGHPAHDCALCVICLSHASPLSHPAADGQRFPNGDPYAIVRLDAAYPRAPPVRLVVAAQPRGPPSLI